MEQLAKSVLTAVLLCVTPFAAQAAVTTYSSQAAFLTEVGASTTTLDFEAQNPNGPTGHIDPGSPFTIGAVTFAQPENRLWIFGKDFYNTTGLTSSYLNQNSNAPSGINVTFVNPVYGVGMNFGIVDKWNSTSLAVTYTLSTGEVINTSAPLLTGTGNAMAYFGFTSDVAFSSFNINAPSQGVALDNLTFASAVPEPESCAMLLAGLGLMGFMTRRKSGKNAA